MDFTKLARPYFSMLCKRSDRWAASPAEAQQAQLRSLLKRGAGSEAGRHFAFSEIAAMESPYAAFARRVVPVEYEDIREDVMRMVNGEADVLWPGRCMDFAQSSGTSGGRSKYVPITRDSLQRCHYAGASYVVANYLRCVPDSRLFSGKAFILGGSFASELHPDNPSVRIGDLSASLIRNINPLAGLFRIPSASVALMPDWESKLPALVKAASHANVTNLSGVPSWFLTVIKGVMKERGVEKISDAWPNLEVFFHGGISFEPYRQIYSDITDPTRMHFMETYNASEGFFAAQDRLESSEMLLILDNDVFYEFVDISEPGSDPRPIWEIEPGKVYELLITSSNGLWRYRIGDTVRVESISPVRIRIAGRTKAFINAFGEELMEENAERGIAEASESTGGIVRHYTAAPVYADGAHRGRHQWIIEWEREPSDIAAFARVLDASLRKVNSDYDAKRTHTIFLDPPEVITVPSGAFERWLHSVGSGRLGGQRKVPRLRNDRSIADAVLTLISQR